MVLKQANWGKYRDIALFNKSLNFPNTNEKNNYIVEILNKAGNLSIPKSSTNSHVVQYHGGLKKYQN